MSSNHFNAHGEAHMVDIGHKANTERVATASGSIVMQAQTFAMIKQGDHKKGDVLAIARLAGIGASKQCANLIPLCHTILLTHVSIRFEMDAQNSTIQAISMVKTTGQTGVEMEALTATSIALLTIYDMCKGVDRGMTIHNIALLEKTGGQSGSWQRF